MTSQATSVAKFSLLVQELLARFPDSPLVARTMEASLSELLELIQNSPAQRSDFARIFVAMLQGEQESPEWLIAYCMRTLRWPEVERAAEAVRRAGDPRKVSLAWEVLGAYEADDDWDGAHLFDRTLASGRGKMTLAWEVLGAYEADDD